MFRTLFGANKLSRSGADDDWHASPQSVQTGEDHMFVDDNPHAAIDESLTMLRHTKRER